MTVIVKRRDTRRTVVWFSAGAPSAVAAKLTLAAGPAVIAFCDTGVEHSDTYRFLDDCEEWFGQEVVKLKSKRYGSTWDVYEKRRFLVSANGALCTAEMKKKPRFDFERPSDIQIMGFTLEEQKRANRFLEQNPGVDLRTPLISAGLTKPDCLAMVERAGLKLPHLYSLGFAFANCIPCVKGGMGYWNKIRIEFPNEFARMALLERELGRSILREKDPDNPSKKRQVFLDELDPNRGDFATEPKIECGVNCEVAEDTYADSGTVVPVPVTLRSS